MHKNLNALLRAFNKSLWRRQVSGTKDTLPNTTPYMCKVVNLQLSVLLGLPSYINRVAILPGNATSLGLFSLEVLMNTSLIGPYT